MADRPRCVYCRRRPSVARWRPFCSERCKMADLGRWLGGDYRIAGPGLPAAGDEPAGDEPGSADRETR